jgi:hypothetical protein
VETDTKGTCPLLLPLDRSTWARLTYFFSRSVAIAKSLNSLFEEPVGQLLIADENLNIIVFEAQNEVIVRWIP